MNTSIIGTTEMVAPVIMRCHCDSASPDEKKDRPTGSVRSSGDSMAINGHKNAFQLLKKVNIPKAEMAGQT